MRVLITGGAGFIGSHFLRYWLHTYPESDVVVLDKLTYAGRRENVWDVLERVRFVQGDIGQQEDVERAMVDCDVVFNFAAEIINNLGLASQALRGLIAVEPNVLQLGLGHKIDSP